MSDIDIAVAASLRVLDLNGRLEKPTSSRVLGSATTGHKETFVPPTKEADLLFVRK